MPIDAKSQKSLVSVIITTYNRSSYLKKAIESAVQQTYQNVEIIVSDDCSSESPQAIIERFQDSRIRFRRNAKNLGIALNFVNAVMEARGKYVASLNDDDLWNEDFLEKLVPHLDANPDLALAFCDHYIVDSNGTINYPATEKNTRHWKRNQLKEGVYQPFCEIGLVHQAVPTSVAAVIRKDVIEWDNFPQEAGVFWDLYLTYLACCSDCGAYYYPGRLTRYRESAQSIIRSGDVQAKLRKAKADVFCYKRFMEDERLQEFRLYFKRKWAHANTTMGINLLKAKQVAEARPYFLCALSQQKFNLRTLAALMLSFTPQPLASRFLSIQKRGSFF
jgi:glycosyltransferase involved in cell wall biosynthesis